MSINPDLPHRRFNPLTGDWVLVSPQRMKRPWQGKTEPQKDPQLPDHDSGCYLCPGNPRAGGKINPDYPGTYVFDNDFPALVDQQMREEPEIQNSEELFKVEKVSGISRVLCFSPSHRLTLPELELEQIMEVIGIWEQQSQELGDSYRWVQIFENKGTEMGCSNPNPHGQIWASNQLPSIIEKEDLQQQEFFQKHRESLLLQYGKKELRKEERIVEENPSWLAVVPYWAVWPFELLLLPNRDVKRLTGLNSLEKEQLAEILKKLLSRYDNLFQTSFPYSMGWHGAPFGEESSHWQLHAHFYPPLLRSASVRKFMVGYELLAEAQRDLTPEQAAERLRGLSPVHYLLHS